MIRHKHTPFVYHNHYTISIIFSPKYPTSYNINFATFADYKTTEVNTGVKWIDGKPIYKKTITGSITFSANVRLVTTVPTGLIGAINMLDITGYFDRSSSAGIPNRVPFGASWESVTPGTMSVFIGGYFNSNDNSIVLVTKSDIAGNNKPFALTIFYTKG